MSRSRTRATRAATLVLALLSPACVGTPVRIDNYVPAGIDRSRGRVVEGTAASFQLLIFIPIRNNSRHERAWQNLLSKAPDSYVTNVLLMESWTYAFVGTLYRSTFRATAYPRSGSSSQRPRETSLVAADAPASTHDP